MTDPLDQFTKAATAEMAGTPGALDEYRERRELDDYATAGQRRLAAAEETEESDDDAETDDENESEWTPEPDTDDEEAEPDPGAVAPIRGLEGADISDELWAAFNASLTPGQIEQAHANSRTRDALFRAYLRDHDDGAGVEVQPEDAAPTSGSHVVAWALENPQALAATSWEGTPEQFVAYASTAEGWADVVARFGWSPRARPTISDLPQDVSMASLADTIPGARVVDDPLHRPIGGSKKRIW